MWHLKLAVRNALRNKRRTALTVGTVLFGTLLLTVALSWVGGVVGSMMDQIVGMVGEVRISHVDYPDRENRFPIEYNIEDSGPVKAAAERHGLRVFEIIRTGAIVTADDELGDNFCLMLGADAEYFTEILGAELIAGGPVEDPETQLWLGRELAEEIGADVGDEVVFVGKTQDGSLSSIKGDAVGIVSTGSFLTDSFAYIPLDKVRYFADIEGGAVEVQAYGGDREKALDLAAMLVAEPEMEGLAVQAWMERSPWNQMYEIQKVVGLFLGGIVIFIAALGVLNTMFMSVLERTNEIGVLRAMGMSRFGVVFSFLVEGMAIGVVGSVVGIGLGAVPSYYLEVEGVSFSEDIVRDSGMPMSATFYADLNLEIALTVFVMGMLMAVLGALVPALRASFIQPIDAMRRKR